VIGSKFRAPLCDWLKLLFGAAQPLNGFQARKATQCRDTVCNSSMKTCFTGTYLEPLWFSTIHTTHQWERLGQTLRTNIAFP